MLNWEFFWDILDKIGIVAAVASIFVSLSIRAYLWRKEKRDNTLLDIRLHCSNPETSLTLPAQIRRKNLTRAEIQGLLGILPMRESKGSRYFLPALNNPTFFDALEEAQVNGEVYELVIECSAKELEQFDLSNQNTSR